MPKSTKEQMNERRDARKAKLEKAAVWARIAHDKKYRKRRTIREKKARRAESPEVKIARLEVQQAKTAARRVDKQSLLAGQELARRELARRRLLPFIQRFDPSYQAGSRFVWCG